MKKVFSLCAIGANQDRITNEVRHKDISCWNSICDQSSNSPPSTGGGHTLEQSRNNMDNSSMIRTRISENHIYLIGLNNTLCTYYCT